MSVGYTVLEPRREISESSQYFTGVLNPRARVGFRAPNANTDVCTWDLLGRRVCSFPSILEICVHKKVRNH